MEDQEFAKKIFNLMDARKITDALEAGYPEEILDLMMGYLPTEDLQNAIERFIENAEYPNLAEKYLPKIERQLGPRRFNITGIYPESLFKAIYQRTDRRTFLDCISINKVITHYSAELAELLLDNGKDIDTDTLGLALDRQYPEGTLRKILAKISSEHWVKHVSSADVEKAQAKGYSAELVNLMKQKTDGVCIIS